MVKAERWAERRFVWLEPLFFYVFTSDLQRNNHLRLVSDWYLSTYLFLRSQWSVGRIKKIGKKIGDTLYTKVERTTCKESHYKQCRTTRERKVGTKAKFTHAHTAPSFPLHYIEGNQRQTSVTHKTSQVIFQKGKVIRKQRNQYQSINPFCT